MISYYFTGKPGLYEEMIKEMLTQNLSPIEDMIDNPNRERLKLLFNHAHNGIPTDLILIMFRALLYERNDVSSVTIEKVLKSQIGMADGLAKKLDRSK